MKNDNQQFWEEFSAEYEKSVGETGDVHHEFVINPVVFALLGDLKGKTVLDAGCGNGYLSRKMAKAAKKVVGIDFTKTFIQTAKERSNGYDNLTFLQGNLEKMPFSDREFDSILCNMVLINVENLDTVVGELSRALKTDGRLVVSITHPCFENLPFTYSLKDEKGKTTARVVTRYFTTGLTINTEDKNQFHYHYTLSDYFNAFSEHGLCLEKTVEPDGCEVAKDRQPDITPTFLILRLKKN